MEAKHTKRPWLFDGECITTESGLAVIATVERDQGVGQEAEHNARLLCAAPDLLEACNQVLLASEDGGDMNDIDWNGLRAAVAKAAGGQP